MKAKRKGAEGREEEREEISPKKGRMASTLAAVAAAETDRVMADMAAALR